MTHFEKLLLCSRGNLQAAFTNANNGFSDWALNPTYYILKNWKLKELSDTFLLRFFENEKFLLSFL